MLFSSFGFNGPDGGGAFAPTNIQSLGGISGIGLSTTLFLVGVFLDDTVPSDPPPPILNFSGTSNFLELAHQLRQTFFVGDGLTGTGSGQMQKFIVPESATRLFYLFIS